MPAQRILTNMEHRADRWRLFNLCSECRSVFWPTGLFWHQFLCSVRSGRRTELKEVRSKPKTKALQLDRFGVPTSASGLGCQVLRHISLCITVKSGDGVEKVRSQREKEFKIKETRECWQFWLFIVTDHLTGGGVGNTMIVLVVIMFS